MTSNRTQEPELAAAVAGYLQEVGIDAAIQVVEFGVFLEETSKLGPDNTVELYLSGYGGSDPDAVRIVLACDEWGARNNSHYCNPEVDDLFLRARSERDEDLRRELYARAFELVMQDAPWILIDDRSWVYGWRKTVKGIEVHQSHPASLDLRNVEIVD